MRGLLVVSAVALIVAAATRGEASEPSESSASLVASIRPSGSAVRAGVDAVMEVEIKNASPAAVTVAFENIVRSYFFTTEANDGGSSQGTVEGGVSDRKKYRDRCPGDVPTFVLERGQTLVQLVGIPIPKTLRGEATLHLGLRVLRVISPPRCTPSTALNLAASAVLQVSAP